MKSLDNKEINIYINRHMEWIKTGRGKKADFSSMYIKNFDFSDLDLSEAIFQNSILEQVCFYKTNLRKANFCGTRIKYTNLRDADLRESIFNNANFFTVDIAESDLSYAKFISAELEEVNFNGYGSQPVKKPTSFFPSKNDPTNVIFNMTDFSNALFRGSWFPGMDFRNTILQKATFLEGEIAESIFDNVNAANSHFLNCYLDNSSFVKSNLQGSSFISCYLLNANFKEADVTDGNFSKSNIDAASFFCASLKRTIWGKDLFRPLCLIGADLSETNLNDLDLSGLDLTDVNFSNSILKRMNFSRCDLTRTNFSNTDLSGSNFTGARFIETKLMNANLSDCKVYGISVWEINLKDSVQENLIITRQEEPVITVDNIEIAQFIYLLIKNEKLRSVLEEISTKIVLILGRFTSPRKQILDWIRNKLREYNYLPVLFDFECPSNRDLTETITTLAHLSRFIIADLTNAKSIPQELKAIVPNLPSVPIKPILLKGQNEYSMFEHFRRFPWVLPISEYENLNNLKDKFSTIIINPIETKLKEIRGN